VIAALRDRCSWRQINFVLTVVWLIMVPVAVVTGWIYSIAFISAVSLYANVASHLAAWRADVPNVEETE
jgi:hypothetical protein